MHPLGSAALNRNERRYVFPFKNTPILEGTLVPIDRKKGLRNAGDASLRFRVTLNFHQIS